MATDRVGRHSGAAAGARPARPIAAALRATGAGLIIAAAAVHLDLYLTGYRSIPVIGGLFLVQVIVGLGVGAAVLVTGSRLAAAAGALFALATLGGYLLSVWTGLFGFTEVRTAAGIAAGVIEVAAFATLAATAWLGQGGHAAAAAIGGVSVIALALLGVAVTGAGGPPGDGPPATPTLRTATIGGATVLTSGRGMTLYWFAPDTPDRSVCTGACAQYWPPLTGTPAPGPGIPGRLGTITRPDGPAQVTYDGHPLYTYVADTAPGQARGNNINLNGGVWHEVTTAD
jgi:predicted lipoprotein with Yx(FWY)xxD motif